MTNKNLQVRAIIFDWAGTVIDYGSRAPAAVFQAIFEQEGIKITTAQAREPMGMAKLDHIRAVLEMPEVQQSWLKVKGQPGTESDVDRMYQEFLPLLKSTLSDHCQLIPGAIETFRWCKEQDIQVGGTTGYTRELMEIVRPLAAQQGYIPNITLAAEDAPQGRPAPWMIFDIAKQFNVYPLSQIVKVDDTIVGIEAGLNAGCWTVAVTKSGNETGLSEEELTALPKDEQDHLISRATKKFLKCGAHYVIESVAEIPTIIEQINQQLADGKRTPPHSM